MSQFLTIVLWTALEYLLLKVFAAVAPTKFDAFITKVFGYK